MLGHKILAAATLALGFAFTTSTAQAAPQLLLPDTNFVTHNNTFCMSGPGLKAWDLTVDTTKGDFMTIDRGTGFTAVSSGLLVAHSGCNLTLTINGELKMTANFVSDSLKNSLVGKDLFATYKVSSSTIPGYKVGQTIVLDGLVFNINAQNCGQIKGDIAPVVPEPATLSLVLLGLGGLAGSVRRKLS